MMQPNRRFAFRLCLALGVEHPDILMSRITSRQFAEWMAYFSIRQFGETDRLLANLCALMFNAHRGKSKAVTSDDYLPDKANEQTPDQMKTILRGILSGHRKNH